MDSHADALCALLLDPCLTVCEAEREVAAVNRPDLPHPLQPAHSPAAPPRRRSGSASAARWLLHHRPPDASPRT